jgi:ribosomal protein S18 acetylase RimI-like enzyme
MEIEIRVLQRSDEHVLRQVAADVFDHPLDPALTREFLADPRHHMAVAIDAGVVVGFASGVHYVHPDKAPELWINEVAIAPTHRRRGLGQAVVRALLAVGRAHHCTCAWTLTYRGNAAARALYASAGGEEGADRSGPSAGMLGYTFPLGDDGASPSAP